MSENVHAAGGNEWLVKYSDDYRVVSEVRTLYDATHVEHISNQVDLITFPEDLTEEAIAQVLENDPSIEYAEPNYERNLFGVVNDPHYTKQWWVPYVKAERAWTYVDMQQKKVVVAVIDSGIDVNHEDLQGRIEPGGFNFPSNNSNVTDMHGHGTQVSGVIAAESGNGKGITGIAGTFEVSLLPLKITTDDAKSTVANLIKAIDYAVEKKVDVINMSLGGPRISQVEKDAIQHAIDEGIVVVAAAGNEALKGNAVNYPASYEEVISVGAIDQISKRASFSNYNAYVDLVAPGVGIYTTSPYHSYRSVNGTSFSAPVVSGTVAMMKAIKPALTKDEIVDLLTATATDIGPIGRDDEFGAGLLNIDELMTFFDNPLISDFKGDFPDKHVDNSWPFTVTFNQRLNTDDDYSDKIVISRDIYGEEPVNSFIVEVDETAPEYDRLLIMPTTKWAHGDHYLMITKSMYNDKGQTLKKDVRMKFVVE